MHMHSKFCITVRFCFVFSRYFLQNKYHPKSVKWYNDLYLTRNQGFMAHLIDLSIYLSIRICSWIRSWENPLPNPLSSVIGCDRSAYLIGSDRSHDKWERILSGADSLGSGFSRERILLGADSGADSIMWSVWANQRLRNLLLNPLPQLMWSVWANQRVERESAPESAPEICKFLTFDTISTSDMNQMR